MVERVLAMLPAFNILSQDQRLPGRDEGDGFYAAVIARAS